LNKSTNTAVLHFFVLIIPDIYIKAALLSIITCLPFLQEIKMENTNVTEE